MSLGVKRSRSHDRHPNINLTEYGLGQNQVRTKYGMNLIYHCVARTKWVGNCLGDLFMFDFWSCSGWAYVVVWVGGLGGPGNFEFWYIYFRIYDVSFMFAGALNHFVRCLDTSKTDFFDLYRFDGCFIEFFLGHIVTSNSIKHQICNKLVREEIFSYGY